MNGKVSPRDFHHFVIVAENPEEAAALWGDIFDFPAPKVNHLKNADPELEKQIAQFIREKYPDYDPKNYPSLYLGKDWKADFSQAVFDQPSAFFEIDGPGTEDYFAEFLKKHGNGVCFLGLLAGPDRDRFVSEMSLQYGCETIIEQYFPGGDWSVVGTEKALSLDINVKKEPGGDHTLHPLLPDFSEMLVLVPDLTEAVKNWNLMMNAGIEKITEEEGNVSVNGRERRVTLKHAVMQGRVFPVHLVEAGADSPFAEYVKKHGYGVFEAAFRLDPKTRDRVQKKLTENGMPIELRFSMDGSSYTVFNTVDRMGVNISLL